MCVRFVVQPAIGAPKTLEDFPVVILPCSFVRSSLRSCAQYLEEDRRRVLLAAKEARSNRRKDDRQLKEYVQTLEVHLDQVL